MAATKKPTGLAIARNGWTYTFSWKIADADYGKGQTFQWRINSEKWQTVTVGAGTTAKSVSLTAANFYPTTTKKISSISFRVRGKRRPVTKNGKTTNYDWSEYATATKTINLPRNPVLSTELLESNQCRFSWDTVTDTKDALPFVNVEWQTRLIKASDVTDGSKLSWKSSVLGWATGTGSATGYSTRTEESELLAADSYTRWFRVRSRGPRGAGDWKYAKHVYALPYKPTVKRATAKNQNQGTLVTMNWTAPAGAAHPIDYTEAQYLIDTPASGMAAPAGSSWSVGMTSRDTGGEDAATFLIDNQVGLDKCLWVRACAYHDTTDNVNRSAAFRALTGKLTAPTNLTVNVNTSTYYADVSAQNNSAVPDSKLAILYKDADHDPFVCGIIAHGNTDPVTVRFPNFAGATNIAFGVYAFQGSTSYTTVDGVNYYTVTANMISSTLWNGGAVPLAPDPVTATLTDNEGEVRVTWKWTWRQAMQAEISWSTNPNAWESTVQPSTFVVDNLYASNWRVSGLTLGSVWYFRVRLGKVVNGEVTYGPYSELVSADLSSAPSAPVLESSEAVTPRGKAVTVSWTYVSTDGTLQRSAEIVNVTVSGSTVTYGTRIAKATTATSVKITPSKVGWLTGETHYIAVRVTSGSGRQSAWSDPIPITIADPITITVTATSLETITITDEDENQRSVTALTEMPLTATITGAGAGGTTTLVIERAEDYIMDRPDESQFNGYAGETVFIFSQTGEAQISVGQEDLIGILDDGAPYRLIATVEDSYGQTAEASIDFEVHWDHQAIMPDGTVLISDAVAVITPIGPVGATGGDVCDVYRLSADAPVLVLEGATWGEDYVDPYPAIGDMGGYRFVFRTENGDYITEDNQLAWLDVPAGLPDDVTLIDFDGNQVALPYNFKVTHSWEKDFTETTYLGGAIQGDWNLAVHRRTTANADLATDDPDIITGLRRLAAYPGICHVRTVDGSSFAADVQVSEARSFEQAGKIAQFTISITEVSPQKLDGMLYDEWYTAPEGATGET